MKKRSQRVNGELDPSQKRRVRKVQKLIVEELPELIRRNQKAHDAAKEKTFSGGLRRAIHGSKFLLPDLARRADVDMGDIADFLTGERTLPSDAIDRLIKVLKLKLPTSKRKPQPRRRKAS
jgi:hypothetical protein